MRFSSFILVFLLLGIHAEPARASEFNKDLEVYGYAQAWLTLYEEMEETRGLFQNPSRDEAADVATGFRLHRARAGLRYDVPDSVLGVNFQLKFESPIEILDLVVRVQPWDWLVLNVGQFKFPSVRENLEEDSSLDFLLRSDLSTLLADYSLSRTIYPSSLFYGNRSLNRDFGIGLKLNVAPWNRPLRVFLMVGNGLGGNLFVGGATQREFLVANRGQFLYAGRAEFELIPRWLELGGHASYNRHDNVVFNSGRVVLDLYRVSWSADAKVTLGGTGVRIEGAVAQALVLEDAYGDGKADFAVRGWETRVVWRLNPLLAFLGMGEEFSSRHGFELAARFEQVETEVDESGSPTTHRNLTLGGTYYFREDLALRFNSILRWTNEPFVPDLKDNAYILGLQVKL